MSEDINVTDGTVLEALNNKVDLDGGNYIGSPLEEYIHKHCGGLENKITNCILEAPNGIASYSGSTITVKSGIKVLIPYGKNEDGTFKNIEYTTDERVYTEEISRPENDVITIAIENNGRINAYANYFSQEENPNNEVLLFLKPTSSNVSSCG